jgi:cytochrome P450
MRQTSYEIPHATKLESLTFSLIYSLPEVARGVVIRRPSMMRRLARLDTQAAAQRFCMRLRVRYGGRSIYVRGRRKKTVLVLSQGDVERVLTGSDSVFSLRTDDKWRAFSPVQPDSLLLSQGKAREDQRRFTHAVLQPGEAPHDLARRIDQVMAEELDAILGRHPAVVHWGRLRDGCYRAILRLVLGDAARDDAQILAALNALRGEGNWLGLRPWRRKRVRTLRQAMMAGIGQHVAAAADGSLAGLFATAPQTPLTRPAVQVPHWLMALEGLGTTVIGPTLALLAGHPEHDERARAEARAAGDRAYLRACLHESLRLWPLVPTLLRVVTTPTGWHGTTLAAGTGITIPVAVHNRNPQIDYADAFTPQAWLDGRATADWWIVPFSAGPGRCPGADLGSQVGASMLATLLRQYDFHPAGPKLGPDRPLPKTLDPFSLRLNAQPVASGPVLGA